MKRLLLFLLFFDFCYSHSEILRVRNQNDYNKVNSVIHDCTDNELTIIFEPGVFYFNDNNILKIEKQNNGRLLIKGTPDTFIVSDGENYSIKESEGIFHNKWYKVKLKKRLDKYCTYQDDHHHPIRIGDTGFLNYKLLTNIANSGITLYDSIEHIARIEIPEELYFLRNKNRDYFKNSLICYKAQWSDCYREVLYSDDCFIYFQLSEWLQSKFNDYVGNMYRWSKINAKTMDAYTPFFITNISEIPQEGHIYYDDNYIYIPIEKESIHVCRYNKWIDFLDNHADVSLDGLQLFGSSLTEEIMTYGGLPYDFRSDLIHFIRSSHLSITNSLFANMGGTLCCIRNSKNVSISNCKFINNYTDGIVYFLGTLVNSDFVFKNNYINNPDKLITHIECIHVNSGIRNVNIIDNECLNISRSFVKLGVSGNIVYIIGNDLHNTSFFSKYPVRNLSSDTGVLIYSHKGSPVVIENNIVHDLPSNLLYNCIMVDNGTGNAIIQNNLFYNIGDYAIYCWKSNKEKSNLNNYLSNNIILGKINYGGYDKLDHENAAFCDNLLKDQETLDDLNKRGATNKGGNQIIKKWTTKNEFVILNKDIYKKIINNPHFSKKIKGRIKHF